MQLSNDYKKLQGKAGLLSPSRCDGQYGCPILSAKLQQPGDGNLGDCRKGGIEL